MNIGARKTVLVSTLCMLLVGGLLISFSGVAQAEDRARIDSLFEQAKDNWERGHSDKAAQLLRTLLAEDPSHETAYDLLRKAEYQMFLDMLKQGGDAELVAKELLRLAHLGEQDKVKDDGAIRVLVEQAIHGETYADREQAVRTLVAKHGEYAVPYLYHYLGSNDTDERVYAILALSELGSEAVLPLTEALHSDDFKVQQNAALVLQKIGDLRAIGGLASLAAHADNAGVQQAAGQAAASLKAKITCGGGKCGAGCQGGNCSCCQMKAGEMTPAGAYLMLARKYYLRDAAVIKNYSDSYVVWSWKDGKLSSRETPANLYNLELAEEACYDALTEEEGNVEARRTLAAIHYAEWGALATLPEDLRADEAVKALSDRVWNVLAITAAQGADTQLGALKIGLKWRDATISMGAMNALPEVWDGREIGADSPLVAALDAPDKIVRFAAAICLLELRPMAAFPGAEKVAPIAAQAADAGSARQVLLIEPTAEVRAQSLRDMDKMGLYSVAEASAVSGFRRAKEAGTFDVIVIRASLLDKLAMTVIKDLQTDFRTSAIPILVTGMGEELETAKELLGTKVQGFILAEPLDVEAVKNAASQSLNDDQKRALAVSKDACMALAMIHPAHTAFANYADAEGALDGVVASDKPDDIRLAAYEALKVIGSVKSVGALVAAFKETANATPVRIGAAETLGKILAGTAAPAEVFDALLSGFGDEAQGVRKAAGVALGEMMLTDTQKNAVLTAYRVE
jgi:DNA-binding NarL/FixJ family response regulator